jgi:PilZ domain
MGIERRNARRRHVRQRAVVASREGAILGKCLMLDVSATGAKLQLQRPDMPTEFILILSVDGGLRRHCVVEWTNGKMAGVRFRAAH